VKRLTDVVISRPPIHSLRPSPSFAEVRSGGTTSAAAATSKIARPARRKKR
jgi:hypothetical protein